VSVRDKREAVLTRWHGDLRDDFRRALPLVLDDLDAIDAAGGDLEEARAEAGELRHECDSLAALLVEACAERDALRARLAPEPAFTAGEAAQANPAVPSRVKPPAGTTTRRRRPT
jgi:hypothetical protein